MGLEYCTSKSLSKVINIIFKGNRAAKKFRLLILFDGKSRKSGMISPMGTDVFFMLTVTHYFDLVKRITFVERD